METKTLALRGTVKRTQAELYNLVFQMGYLTCKTEELGKILCGIHVKEEVYIPLVDKAGVKHEQ